MRIVVLAVILAAATWQPSAARPWQAWATNPTSSGTRGGPFPGSVGHAPVRGPPVVYPTSGSHGAPQGKSFGPPRPQPVARGKAIEGDAAAQQLDGAVERTIRISDLLPSNSLGANDAGQVRLEDLTATSSSGISLGEAVRSNFGTSAPSLGGSSGISLGEAVSANAGGQSPTSGPGFGTVSGISLAEAASGISPGISSSGSGAPDFSDIPPLFGGGSPGISGGPVLSTSGATNAFPASPFPSSSATISSQANSEFTSDDLLTGGTLSSTETSLNPILPELNTAGLGGLFNPIPATQTASAAAGGTKSFFRGSSDPIANFLSTLTLGLFDSRSNSGGRGGALPNPLAGLANLDVLGLGREFVDGLVQMAATNLDSITRETNTGLRLLQDEVQFQGQQALENVFKNFQQTGRTVGNIGMNTYRGILQKQSAIGRFVNGIVDNLGDFADQAVNKTITKVVNTATAIGRFISDVKLGFINALIAKGEALRGLVEGTLETAGSAVGDITKAIRGVAEDNIRAITGLDKRFRRSAITK